MINGRKLEIKWKFSAGYFQHLKHQEFSKYISKQKLEALAFGMSTMTNIRNTQIHTLHNHWRHRLPTAETIFVNQFYVKIVSIWYNTLNSVVH